VKKVALVLTLIVLAVVVSFWFHRSPKTTTSSPKDPPSELAGNNAEIVTSSPRVATPPAGKPAPLIGENILRDYANPALPAEHDLTLVSRLMDNFTLLVKSARQGPLSANEDWAAAFRGRNPAQQRFLPDQHTGFNAKGQLVDRWGTPLFFHALGGGRFELRSGGPDQQLWTADDLHRNADGSFRRGPALNASSLLDAASR
jgi:hypothetical protein